LPKIVKEIHELEKQNNSLIDEIKMCEHDMESAKEEIVHLLKTEQDLKSNIITDNEVTKLVKYGHYKSMLKNLKIIIIY